MIRNWAWLVGLVAWATGCMLFGLGLTLALVGLSASVVVPVCLMVAPVVVACLTVPVADRYLASLGAGEVLGPLPGAVFGLRRFEARRVAVMRARRNRRLERFGHTVRLRVLRDSECVASLPGSLLSKDLYGQRYCVGTGVLVAADDRLTFIASSWAGRRCVVLGSARAAAGLSSVVTVSGDASLELHISSWRSATSLPSDEAWLRPDEPGALQFVRHLNSADRM